MQEERNELVKFIFPQLRKLCEQRGVTWGDVDLRWGITDEQKAEGRVLSICLDEIQRCRPYFIGLLGERYGWIPDEIPVEIIEREAWLKNNINHSVTELEILHGVLNNPEMAKHAFFYLRDPKYLDTLEPEERAEYQDEDGSLSKRNLMNLKERIRGSGLLVHENYQNPKELGKLVFQDLKAVIESVFPEGSQPNLLEREAVEHEAFAQSRTRVHIGRQSYFNRMDTHARSNGQPLVILGESGAGKSALLARWAILYRKEHADELVLMHFIGATPGSADWAAMLRRILGEIKRKFDIREEIPDEAEMLRSAFANWLNMASAQGRMVLILDGLNQLDDHDGALDLVWLPPYLPGNVRIFLSTLPGRALDELQKRGWEVLKVEPLVLEERKQLIREYLALFTKALSPTLSDAIAEASQCQNPLFLRVLLDELRLIGKHEQLGERIQWYLCAENIPALYELILERCEQDYERERPGLVGESMALLWAARRGLSEGELMELLGTGGKPMPRLYLSALFLALEQSFLSRAGLIGFFHDYLREAVRNRYLVQEHLQRRVHLRLADYFDAQSGTSPRRLEELPWQIAQAREWQRLYGLLGNLEFFEASWKLNSYEAKIYWTQMEADSQYHMVEAYHQVIGHPGQYHYFVWNISNLLNDTGHIEEAFALRSYLVEQYRSKGDEANLQAALCLQANILYFRGELDQAMALYKEQEHICRKLGDKAGLAAALNNQAIILKDQGKLEIALTLHKDQERMCGELGDKAGLINSLSNQGLILKMQGELAGAMALHKEEEKLCRELGNLDGLQITLGNQALILKVQGKLDEAIALHREEQRICRQLGNKHGLQFSLGNLAWVLYVHGDLDEAMALDKEQERLCRELGNKAGLQDALGGQATILFDRGDLDGAMVLLKERERLCRDLGNKIGLERTLGVQALIVSARGDQDGAMRLHKEEERISRELGDKDQLQATLGNQAIILSSQGDQDGAMNLYKEAEQICRAMGNKLGLRFALSGQANILSLGGNNEGAMKLHKEAEHLCHELGDKAGLESSFGRQALILLAQGNSHGALELFKEQENICRDLGLIQDLVYALANQAVVLRDMGQVGLATPKAEEAHNLAIHHRLTIVQWTLAVFESVLK